MQSVGTTLVPWNEKMKHEDGFIDNLLEPSTDGTKFSRIFYGLIIPIVIATIGIINIHTQNARISLRSHSHVTGTQAIICGTTRILIAAFLHVHFYWTVSEKLWKYSYLLKILLLIGIILTLILFIYTIFRTAA